MEWFLLSLGAAGFYIFVLIVFEYLRRTQKLSSDITRRAIHIFSGICTVVYYKALPEIWFISLIVISLIVVTLSLRFGWLTSVHNVARRTYGEIFLPLGTLCTYSITQKNETVFIASILVVAFADSIAGMLTDYLKSPKQLVRSSLLFFLITCVILSSLGYPTFVYVPAIALTVTLVERYSPLGSDNLTVPVSTALLLLLFKA